MTVGGNIFYFRSAAIIRQLLKVLLTLITEGVK
jgi:hypothetical protein